MGVPGQPLIVFEIAPNTRFGSGATQYFTDVTNRVRGRWRFGRGQQYQRSQAQAGSLSVNLRNTDGALDPGNTASPYWPFTLYSEIRARAQYPATRNLLIGDQATAGEVTPLAAGAVPASLNITAYYAAPQLHTSGSAWQGGQVYQVTVPSSSATGHELIQLLYLPIQATTAAAPATQYAWSIYVRSGASGANPTVAAQIQWMNVAGQLVSTTSGTATVLTGASNAAWTRVSVAGTPPAGAVYANLAVVMTATAPGISWAFQADGLQAEIIQVGQAAAATAWIQPGTWYPLWGGAINDDPRAYSGDGVVGTTGNYSVARVGATDVLGCLAQARLADCYTNTLLTYGPNFIYTLADPAFPTGAVQKWQDWTGQRGPVSVIGGYQNEPGSLLVPGSGITGISNTNTGVIWGPQGVNGTVVALSGAARYYDAGPTYPDGRWIASGITLAQNLSVGPPPNSAWTRVMAFEMDPVFSTHTAPVSPEAGAPLLRSVLFSFVGAGPTGYPQISLSAQQPITWSGGVPTYGTTSCFFEAWNSSGTYISQTLFTGTLTIDSGHFMLAAVSLSSNGQQFTIQLGDVTTNTISTYTVSTGGADFRHPSPTSYLTDTLGAWWAPWQQPNHVPTTNTDAVQYGMNGQLSTVAEFGYAITGAQFADMFTAFCSAYLGDGAGTRFSRYLSWAGYTGPSTIDTGATTMGAAGGLGSAVGPYSGQSALTAAQPLPLVEHGMMFAAADGTPAFRGRIYRFSQAVPDVVFGESPPVGAAGEVPYTDVAPGYDAVELINTVVFSVSSAAPGSTSIPVGAADPGSIGTYYPQPVQQTINPADTGQAQNLANWLANANSQPRERVQSLRVDPARTQGVWPKLLGLELDRLIRVNRRPLGAPALSIPAFTENILWEGSFEGPAMTCTLQASPAMLDAAWLPAATHTTLSLQANSGTNTITIQALAAAPYLPLSSLIPPGWQLQLDPSNPSLAETVTIAPGGIPATSPGWTSATITLKAVLAHTHAAGAVVCDVLPAGVTDPTIYDWRSMPAAATTALTQPAAAGTNTVTIGPLADSRYNPLNQSIPVSWTFWLSPGTPNQETVTVAPGGIPQTAPGWQQATLTLTANLAHSHAAGDWVCDPLPAGVTNPTAVIGTIIPSF